VLAGGSLEVAASVGLPEHADISTAEPDKVRADEALLIKALEMLSDFDSPAPVRGALRDAEEVPRACCGRRSSSLGVLGRVGTGPMLSASP
jgi:hypothetical protein